MSSKCVAFQWIGQPITSCDGCRKPAWEHNYREGAFPNPFSQGTNIPWPDHVVYRWLQHGRINRERAASLLAVKVPS